VHTTPEEKGDEALNAQRTAFLLAAALLLAGIARTGPAAAAGGAAALPKAGEVQYVALTFDDGPRRDTTGPLLDGLRKRGASATFFLVGEQIAANADLVKRMQAEGHQVGNHTWSHTKLQGADNGEVLWEIGKTDAALRSLLGDGVYWVRPPYGLLDERQRSLFRVPLVQWSVDPEDWKLRSADADVRAVLSRVKPGSIILMHDSVPASVTAALRIVDAMEAEGYVFVTVAELLALSGVEPRAGTLYLSAAQHS
jgi:peptidoglycan/xylan/chitin deacetylase (PgdA/CDA1 family)